MDSDKLQKKIKNHKQLISAFISSKIKELLIPIQLSGKEIVLVIHDFKCVKCQTDKNLTYHHFLTRRCKEFMKEEMYFTQRHYFANISLLCKECHAFFHNFQGDKKTKFLEEAPTIPEDHIAKIKKKYEIQKDE